MVKVKLFLGFILALLASTAMAQSIRPDARGSGSFDFYENFESKIVKPRNVVVWLPNSYSKTGQKYKVVYMHDGAAAFDPNTNEFNHQSWEANIHAQKLIDEGKIEPVIIVAIYNTGMSRGREYMPSKIVWELPKKEQKNIFRSWNGQPIADDYLKFLVSELKPIIDKNYNVFTDAANTSIMGSSMGGLISFYAQSEYPNIFGSSASLSMHFPITGNFGYIKGHKENLSEKVAAAFDAYLTKINFNLGNHKIYIDYGNKTLDETYPPFANKLKPIFAKHGAGKDFSMLFFENKDHSEISWNERLDIPLIFLAGKR